MKTHGTKSCKHAHFSLTSCSNIIVCFVHTILLAEKRFSGGERNGLDSPKASVTHIVTPSAQNSQLQRARDLDSRQSRTASTATKELDDLMASLSDFKVNVSAAPTPTQARLSGDYAKPSKAKPPSPSKL